MSILAAGFSFASSPGVLTRFGPTISSGHAFLAAATNPADDSETVSPAAWVIIAVWVAAALIIALATGVFRLSRVDGPLRQPANRPLWPLVMAIGIAIAVWMGSNVFYVLAKQAIDAAHNQATHSELVGRIGTEPVSRPAFHTTMVDFAVLSTLPGLLAFGWLFFVDRRLARISQLQLGFTRGRLVDGVAKGVLASVMIMPVMFLAMAFVEALYDRLHYSHPGEHELLRLMNEAQSPFLRWCLIGGAIITAPFFEEYLFRGFLQTFLRQTFVGWSMKLNTVRIPLPISLPPASDDMPSALLPPGEAPVSTTVGYWEPTTETLPPAQGKRVWQTWTAILITSLLFASIHEAWSAPLIFVLAIFLGYAYERTGSLWTNITIHLIFNATSTAIYLMQHGG